MSNRLIREQGLAGIDIMDVPLYKVISGEKRRNLVPSSARIKTFSSETKRIPEPKQTTTQAKSGGNNNWPCDK